jgi:hypothetical protein
MPSYECPRRPLPPLPFQLTPNFVDDEQHGAAFVHAYSA